MLEQVLKVERTELDRKAKVLAEDRVAFAKLEEKGHAALKTLYEGGLEKPLAGTEDGPAELLFFLVEALEEVVRGIDPTAEAEARVLSSVALTCVFSHLHLRDPAARLDELLEPVDDEHCAAAAAAVKSQVEALLEKFCAFAPAPRPAMLPIVQLRLVLQVKEVPLGKKHPLLAMTVSRGDGMAAPFLFSFCNVHHASWRH